MRVANIKFKKQLWIFGLIATFMYLVLLNTQWVYYFYSFPLLFTADTFEVAQCLECATIRFTPPFGNTSSLTRVITRNVASSSSNYMRKVLSKRHGQEAPVPPESDAKPPIYCTQKPDVFVGQLNVKTIEASFEDNAELQDIGDGGVWHPVGCVARQRIAVIIPYRDRQSHLHSLLYHLIPVLKKQQLDFQVFVIEQYGNKTFNKGVLLNSGFLEAWDLADFDCFVFHDVDLIPENDKNLYSCEAYPRHMSPEIDKFEYKLPYVMLVGGVLTMPPEIYVAVNGYSNLYWGWGGEDDDMAFRLYESKLGVIRPPPMIGRYKMIRHGDREASPVKVKHHLMRTAMQRFRTDGVNSVKYRMVFRKPTRLYTHIMIEVGEPPHDKDKYLQQLIDSGS